MEVMLDVSSSKPTVMVSHIECTRQKMVELHGL